ncbi:uncharacterized protein TRAVEDRAFT_53439 [Trametes versicolor FP-101664 SS1]|uniref:uncharacterized protein n=1 Tax=Trametes versicolor (strain FP-101664) TaxID=717944 RepID=UPI0004622C9C|nr:uncharacterized protein TRAVEDRAFT_53439 [Trametes versicolor FP-101664 SS1]EIW53022.1 hypothetical protein TRAVEDRAFT_53439 [Trametes versicolor FP-101664 SS1]
MTHIKLEPQDFLALFFPLPAHVAPESQPQWDRNVFQGIENVEDLTQAAICERFLAAVHENALAPNFRLAKWDVEPPNEDTYVERIDAAFFRSESVATNWEDQIVPVSFKPLDSGLDPCDDLPPRTSDWDYLTRMEARKQLFHHAEDVSQYQHRTALYMLLIAERQFRFLRWDASGMIITQAADYVEDPCLLCEMLWRMSLLSDEQLGMDPTAARILPGTDDFKMMDTAAIPQASDVDHTERDVGEDEVIPTDFVFQYVREGFAKSLGAEWPRYRLEVPYEDSVRMFLVGKPAFRASGMAGRGTRGYVALDCKTGRFVWLKDTWRTYLDLLDQEGTVLAHLNSKGVPYVPTLICHGDVLDQVARKPDLWEGDRSQAPSAASMMVAPSPTSMHLSSSEKVMNPPQITPSNNQPEAQKVQ